MVGRQVNLDIGNLDVGRPNKTIFYISTQFPSLQTFYLLYYLDVRRLSVSAIKNLNPPLKRRGTKKLPFTYHYLAYEFQTKKKNSQSGN